MKRKLSLWGALFGLLAILGVLAACGGGGGGHGGGTVIPVSYTGKTDQAVITCDNAVNIVRNAWEMSSKQEIVEVVDEIIGELFDYYPNVPDRIFSICGDNSYANVQLLVNEDAGTFSGQIEFVNYCVSWGVPFDINGKVTFSGKAVETSTEFIVNLVLKFYNVEKRESDGPVLYAITEGKATYVVTIDLNDSTTENVTYNYVLRDNSVPSKTYWFDDLEIAISSATEGSASYATFGGRFYDNDYGYVDIESESPLYVPDIEIPTGILWFYGKGSEAKLSFMEVSTLLEIDVNADGTFDCSVTDIFPMGTPFGITMEGIEEDGSMSGIKAQ